MSFISFEMVEGWDPDKPGDHENYDDGGCTCPPGDDRYLLEIEEGGVGLVHIACGKQPSYKWGDWNDLVQMNPVPVTVEWQTNCDGSPWHGMTPCDCDHWIQITPSPTAPEIQGQLASTQNGACTNCGATPDRWCEHCASCPTGCYGGHPHTDPCPEKP